jgi:hypothetical protein
MDINDLLNAASDTAIANVTESASLSLNTMMDTDIPSTDMSLEEENTVNDNIDISEDQLVVEKDKSITLDNHIYSLGGVDAAKFLKYMRLNVFTGNTYRLNKSQLNIWIRNINPKHIGNDLKKYLFKFNKKIDSRRNMLDYYNLNKESNSSILNKEIEKILREERDKLIAIEKLIDKEAAKLNFPSFNKDQYLKLVNCFLKYNEQDLLNTDLPFKNEYDFNFFLYRYTIDLLYNKAEF